MITDEKLFKIAISYYKNGKTQQDIAKEYGVSHVQVGKYLKMAMDRGIVEIRINAPFVSNDEKTKYLLYLKETFGLENLVLVPSAANEKQSFRFLIEGACDYLIGKYPNKNLCLGFGLGKTMKAICNTKTRIADKKNMWSVFPVANYSVQFDQDCGDENYFSYQTFANAFALNWGCKIDKTFMDLIRTNDDVDLDDYWSKLDVLIGGVGIPISRDPEARIALLGQKGARKYALADIMGDYLNYFFDDEGHIVRPITLSGCSMGLDIMAGIPERIAVASSFQKVFSIIGLLRCNLINTLITDVDTAKNIVEILR